MALARDTRLGPYQIIAAIGAGGMGEVYCALDTKLKRQVAIKIRPSSLATDHDRLARFQREAEVLASLNHPHIAAIYGLEEADGVNAIVMELVEGPTLADRIAQGPIPIDETLSIAQQIAEALEAAHGQGIVHRDLKPANVKVRSDGTVKVLDFGLAKAFAPEPGSASAGDVPELPTITTPAMTRMGVIMGTAAYMSPEQARGKTLDKRTDIWAFGCVLYEMLTGKRPFAGDEISDVLASVLARDPDLAALPLAVPPPLRRLLRRCLQKDRNERLRDIGDARIEIRDALSQTEPELTAVPDAGRRRGERLAWSAALAMLTLALVAALAFALRPASAPSEWRVDIATPPTTSPYSLAISPDGRSIAFVASADGQSRLWLRRLDSGSARAVPGTDGAETPFWSPDNRAVAFFAGGKIKRVNATGGSVQTLASAEGGQSGAWSRDDVILFASLGRPMFRIPANGGEPVALSRVAQQGSDFSPQFLPDSQHFLYYVRGSPEVRGVYVGRLDGGLEPRRLLDSDAPAVYAPSGQLLFVREGTLTAQNFDTVRFMLTGNPFPVAEQLGSRVGGEGLSVSDTGSIAYRARLAGAQRQFVWFDRSGREISKVGDAVGTSLSSPSLSADGQRVVLYRGLAGGNPDIWTVDTRRGVFSRLTSDPADDVGPLWSPDGNRIMFGSNRKGVHDLYQKSVTTGGREELMLATPQNKFATDWSSDARFLLFTTQGPTRSADIWALPLTGNEKPFPVAQTTFEEHAGQFSPDGNWIAYQSDESGRFDVYLQAFPGPGNKWQVSTNGGSQARWRRDGKELFYVAQDGRLMAVPIRLASRAQAPDIGTPVALFAPRLGGAVQRADTRHQYMVAADGQRILVATVTDEATSPISVILNWKPRP